MLTEGIYIVASEGTWVVRAGGAVIGESQRALELHAGEAPAVIYFPREDIGMAFLEPSQTTSLNPALGEARHFHVSGPAGLIRDASWSFEQPAPEASRVAGYVAFARDKVTLELV